MRVLFGWVVVCLWTAPLGAQTPPAAGPAKPALEAPPGDISLDDWKRDDWMLVKPQIQLVELDGYFRLRGDLFRKLDFANGAGLELPADTGTSTVSKADLLPRYRSPNAANFNSTNIRLRVEPKINLTDKLQVVTTFDVFDNLTLGSTPQSLPPLDGTPSNVLSGSQNPPREQTSPADMVVFRRAYGRVTALNESLELKFGRMPDHWGLGMFANDGDCADCDYGTVVDRIALTFRAANHLWSPMYEWVTTGPALAAFGDGGQPVDFTDRDDSGQYSLRIERVDHPKDIRESLRQGETVLNYGLWGAVRRQEYEFTHAYYAPTDSAGEPMPFDPLAPSGNASTLKRHDAFLFIGDPYLRLFLGNIELALEGAVVWGSFKDTFFDDATEPTKTTVYMLGGALEATYRLDAEEKGLALTLNAGFASGDSMPGFGALDRAGTQRGIAPQTLERDDSLNNFQFSPDYHVDLLVFRRIVGTVTDAWYVKPGLTYLFSNEVAAKLGLIYSQAVFQRSVPGDSRMMALEFDAELSYGLARERGPFGASIATGMAFPFGAFENTSDPTLGAEERGGSFAWTLQARLFLNF